jgi:hypothetical protein
MYGSIRVKTYKDRMEIVLSSGQSHSTVPAKPAYDVPLSSVDRIHNGVLAFECSDSIPCSESIQIGRLCGCRYVRGVALDMEGPLSSYVDCNSWPGVLGELY